MGGLPSHTRACGDLFLRLQLAMQTAILIMIQMRIADEHTISVINVMSTPSAGGSVLGGSVVGAGVVGAGVGGMTRAAWAMFDTSDR